MPLTEEQLSKLRTAFRPHAPIEDPQSFVGRQEELQRVREATGEPGLQVVVYGERGCGKTSLSNVATTGLERVQVFCEEDATFATILRDVALRFQANNPATVTYDVGNDTVTVGGVTLPVSKLTGNTLLQILPNDRPFCVILDELDRVNNKSVIASLAELAKNAATYHTNITLVMIGVADTADELLRGHTSNFRNLREVPLSRMASDELRGIVSHGEGILGIKFEANVMHSMIMLSDRMPYYLHLLATSAARATLERGATSVSADDLSKGSFRAAQDADQRLRDVYDFAVLSEKGSRIYRRIVWAMANLDGTSHNVSTITDEANKIAIDENDTSVTPQAIGQALRRLGSTDKRGIVTLTLNGIYRFSNPLMKGFVRLVRHQK